MKMARLEIIIDGIDTKYDVYDSIIDWLNETYCGIESNVDRGCIIYECEIEFKDIEDEWNELKTYLQNIDSNLMINMRGYEIGDHFNFSTENFK